MRRRTFVAVLAMALIMLAAPAARADASCDPLSTGPIVPPTTMSTIEVVAPVGLLIDEVCIVTDGNPVPNHLLVDPLVPSLVLDGEGGAIVQYSASFVIAPESSTDDSKVVVPPQPATIPLADQQLPLSVNAGAGSQSEEADRFGPNAWFALVLLVLGAIGVEIALSHRRKAGAE